MEYLDDIVLDGFLNCIHCSLQYLLDNTNKGRTDMLMEAKFNCWCVVPYCCSSGCPDGMC